MKQPTFIVIGAMKCATSTVCAYLEDHPDVYCVPSCEPNFFSHDEYYEKGLDWFMRFFDGSHQFRHRGEGSNFYSARSLYPHASRRMYELNPDLMIIYLVRLPLIRLVSAWIQRRSDSGGKVPHNVSLAIRELPDEFIGQSRYYHNIEPYLQLFPEENIFIGFMEDLQKDSGLFFSNLCSFLEIDNSPIVRSHVNPSTGKKIPNKTFTTIHRFGKIANVNQYVPYPMKKILKTVLVKGISKSDVTINKDVLIEVQNILESDSEKLLKYAQKPNDFWKFAEKYW